MSSSTAKHEACHLDWQSGPPYADDDGKYIMCGEVSESVLWTVLCHPNSLSGPTLKRPRKWVPEAGPLMQES